MKIKRTLAGAIIAWCLALPASAAEDDTKAFGQFQEVLQGIDQRSFEMVRGAIDQADLSNRVLAHQFIEDAVRDNFRVNFWEVVESAFMQGLPPQSAKASADLIQFSFQDGAGRATLRFRLPNYAYRFQVIELRHDRRGRLKIVDWFDTATGQPFTATISDELVTVMPTKEATRRLLTTPNPTDTQLFQVTEILKAARDGQPPRFFEIYDDLDEPLKREPLIAKRAVKMAIAVKDGGRFVSALEIFVDVYADDPNRALLTADYFQFAEEYSKSYEALKRFYQNFSVKEGAIAAKLSALALAIGEAENAEKFALEATANEPTLELGWWSLLRARARAEDYSGSLEALTRLEDDFGHRLDEAKLRRDKFRGFTGLTASDEFKEWRKTRP